MRQQRQTANGGDRRSKTVQRIHDFCLCHGSCEGRWTLLRSTVVCAEDIINGLFLHTHPYHFHVFWTNTVTKHFLPTDDEINPQSRWDMENRHSVTLTFKNPASSLESSTISHPRDDPEIFCENNERYEVFKLLYSDATDPINVSSPCVLRFGVIGHWQQQPWWFPSSRILWTRCCQSG